MENVATMLRLRIYVNEDDHVHGAPVYHMIVEYLHGHGSAGATVLRSVEGYGRSKILHSERAIDTRQTFAMVIEIIETEQRMQTFIPAIRAMLKTGLLTLEPIDVIANGIETYAQ